LDAKIDPNGEDGDDSFRCFHIVGFDVLLDENGMPHLLEVIKKAAAAGGSGWCPLINPTFNLKTNHLFLL
jgi:hypothetical protein